jgi:methylthioribose-1-phosphate isomerase
VTQPGSSAINQDFDARPAENITGIIKAIGIIKPEFVSIEYLLS